jgi:hypothetical protein
MLDRRAQSPLQEDATTVRSAAIILISLLLINPALAQQNAEEAEEEPYDETGFIRDDIRLSLSFTQGSTDRYDYEDLRIYLTGEAHYAFEGDDYLDIYLLINRFDRSYDDERYERDDPLTNIFDADLSYVLDGIDKDTYGFKQMAGVTLFSDDLFEDVDLGVGYGTVYDYKSGNLKALAGLGRNIGYKDSWSPLADVSWTHNQRLSPQWRLRTKADVTWNEGRDPTEEDEEGDPDTTVLLNGTLYYQLVKGWSLYLRYFNDNGSDRPRSYVSVGVSHRFRRR